MTRKRTNAPSGNESYAMNDFKNIMFSLVF